MLRKIKDIVTNSKSYLIERNKSDEGIEYRFHDAMGAYDVYSELVSNYGENEQAPVINYDEKRGLIVVEENSASEIEEIVERLSGEGNAQELGKDLEP